MLAEVVLVQPVLATGATPYVAAPPPVSDAAAPKLVYPPAPTNSGSPRFVRQTRNNCTFASVAMLLDKWTDGAIRPDQASLRAASGVPDGPVGFRQLARAVATVTGVELRFSPYGGDRMTMEDLLGRLANGGGAVVIGSYSDMPEHYQRWARSYAALGRELSGHAVYVERYEPEDGGRVWLMDPLGRGRKFEGEWISVEDLRTFVWHYRGDLIAAAATPKPKGGKPVPTLDPIDPRPGYRIGAPRLIESDSYFTGQELGVRLPLRRNEGVKRPKDLTLWATWQPLELDPQPAVVEEEDDDELLAEGDEEADPSINGEEQAESEETDNPWLYDYLARWMPVEEEAAVDEDQGSKKNNKKKNRKKKQAQEEADKAAAAEEERAELARLAAYEPVGVTVPLTARGRWLNATLTTPEAPGTYSLSLEVRNSDGRLVVSGKKSEAHVVELRLLGSLATAYGELELPESLVYGTLATATLTVDNLGSLDWPDAAALALAAEEAALAAEEAALDDEVLEDGSLVEQGPQPVHLVGLWQTPEGTSLAGYGLAGLPAGESGPISVELSVPTELTEATLVLELVAADGTPLSDYGYEAVTLDVEFEDPPFVSDDLDRGRLGE
ncbi:MAG: hypothetical protein M3253_04270 [Chloroflexota bacterium]|nr:hypothetical protein [Chloroflexota bacterium]